MPPKVAIKAEVSLRQQKQLVFRDDFRTSNCRVRWETLKPPFAGGEPELLQDLRRAVRETADEISKKDSETRSTQKRLLAVGLKSTARAIKRGDAAAVVICCDNLPSALIQHLPVMCALRGVPAAILAASHFTLAKVIAPLWRAGKVGHNHAVSVALRASCTAHPKLLWFCQQVRRNATALRVPFLLPANSVPACAIPLLKTDDCPTSDATENRTEQVEECEGVIMLPWLGTQHKRNLSVGAQSLRSTWHNSTRSALQNKMMVDEPPKRVKLEIPSAGPQKHPRLDLNSSTLPCKQHFHTIASSEADSGTARAFVGAGGADIQERSSAITAEEPTVASVDSMEASAEVPLNVKSTSSEPTAPASEGTGSAGPSIYDFFDTEP